MESESLYGYRMDRIFGITSLAAAQTYTVSTTTSVYVGRVVATDTFYIVAHIRLVIWDVERGTPYIHYLLCWPQTSLIWP